MKNIASVFWDYTSFSSPDRAIHHLKKYLSLLIKNNNHFYHYMGEEYTFQFYNNPESFIEKSISSETKIGFVLAELKQNPHLRSALCGFRLVKLLRKKRIKIPIVLFSFLDEKNDLDFCDKDDFINARFMQFFVRLPDLKLNVSAAKHLAPLRKLSSDELDNLLLNHYNKKQKASLLLDTLIERLDKTTDDDKQSVQPLVNHTFQTMVKWVPEKAAHGLYLTVLPNKLKRLPTTTQRIELLNQYRSRLLEGVGKEYDGLDRKFL